MIEVKVTTTDALVKVGYLVLENDHLRAEIERLRTVNEMVVKALERSAPAPDTAPEPAPE